jgi:hypothetical protein
MLRIPFLLHNICMEDARIGMLGKNPFYIYVILLVFREENSVHATEAIWGGYVMLAIPVGLSVPSIRQTNHVHSVGDENEAFRVRVVSDLDGGWM